MHVEVSDTKPKAIYPSVQSETCHVKNDLLHSGYMHVQIGLYSSSGSYADILATAQLPLADNTIEHRQLVVLRHTIGTWIYPDIPARLEIDAISPAFLKQRVNLSNIRIKLVDDDLQTPSISMAQKAIEVSECAEYQANIAIICNIVAGSFMGRRMPSTLKAAMYSSRAVIPVRSPIPSPFGIEETTGIDLV